MKFELANLILWFITFAVTWLLSDARISYLAPVYSVCMIGSTLILRRAREITRLKKSE